MTGAVSRPREKQIKVPIETRANGSTIREVAVRLVSINPEAAKKAESFQVDARALSALQREAYLGRLAHSRSCKKPLDDCFVCQVNLKWFATLPPRVLSACLEERRLGKA